MRISFRDNTIMLKNKIKDDKHFVCDWNNFLVEVVKKDKWQASVMYNNSFISSNEMYPGEDATLTKVVQWCFTKIDEYLLDLEKDMANRLGLFNLSRRYSHEVVCPMCRSKKIFRFRLDSDWAVGSGDYYNVNSSEYYTNEETKYDSFDRPDIEIYHCGNCDYLFE